MGIVNVTPDSFSDGGQFLDPNRAIDQALQLVGEGADIVDVGGESTRPGAEPVSAEAEVRRVAPVIAGIVQRSDVLISIDTYKASVARAAIAAGAGIVNDVSGLSLDPGMIDLLAETEVGYVCMHMQGTPQTMQHDPHYDDVVREVCEFFEQRLCELEQAGVSRDRVVLDPGIGFGKTAEHNLQLLHNIAALRSLGRPVLIGHSRKRFLKRLLGRAVDERQAGTVGISIAVASQRADIIRVHDVAANRDALLAWRAILNGGPLPPADSPHRD
jgi:dihydropteroate synthase